VDSTVLVAVIGGLVALLTTQFQSCENRNLRRTELESQLILKAVEPVEVSEQVKRLKFLARAGLISDTVAIMRLAEDTAQLPQFGPNDNPTILGVQRALGELGYYQGAVDGQPGAAFRAAVWQYQKDRALPADSTIGPGLWYYLQADVQARRRVLPPNPGSRPK
jgi:hypothetical protein